MQEVDHKTARAECYNSQREETVIETWKWQETNDGVTPMTELLMQVDPRKGSRPNSRVRLHKSPLVCELLPVTIPPTAPLTISSPLLCIIQLQACINPILAAAVRQGSGQTWTLDIVDGGDKPGSLGIVLQAYDVMFWNKMDACPGYLTNLGTI
ncbi:uncharacterized protein BDR25DRAFT_351494 [Lindgomyces ingoldianus]|uniref:Uncharacterized protein n=1 Tax=Lindgomyces ingoldianus TaxID=673940 RepID=A0ACB6R6T6_9PLEO|nr:uncharacterized protein BDR25DRAFT_351494 [Lindgomyces ingoldianus]KAF2475008.1 hypothetical protein BDR25DRAFT_351494 [Lindgomyces ingoldianus]